ncbi:MAG: hypothetical protein NT166_22050 [Candidatus Aminicenantes bacterium]|nr:hypothetical protein [Candidatus Aminicenantes bacterium]
MAAALLNMTPAGLNMATAEMEMGKTGAFSECTGIIKVIKHEIALREIRNSKQSPNTKVQNSKQKTGCPRITRISTNKNTCPQITQIYTDCFFLPSYLLTFSPSFFHHSSFIIHHSFQISPLTIDH